MRIATVTGRFVQWKRHEEKEVTGIRKRR